MVEEKEIPSPPPLVGPAADAEAATRELKRKKRTKYLFFFAFFVIFQIVSTLIFSLTIMKLRTPKFRVRYATFETSSFTNETSSFNFQMNTQFGLKNTNFGKYQETTVYFTYRGATVGEVIVPKSSVGWRTTKKINVQVNLDSADVQPISEVGTGLRNGILRVNSRDEMKGKVRLVFLINRKKTTNMDCSMDIAIATNQLVNISCK